MSDVTKTERFARIFSKFECRITVLYSLKVAKCTFEYRAEIDQCVPGGGEAGFVSSPECLFIGSDLLNFP